MFIRLLQVCNKIWVLFTLVDAKADVFAGRDDESAMVMMPACVIY